MCVWVSIKEKFENSMDYVGMTTLWLTPIMFNTVLLNWMDDPYQYKEKKKSINNQSISFLTDQQTNNRFSSKALKCIDWVININQLL